MFWGVLAGLILISGFFAINWQRARQSPWVEDLSPNRLLTRYPLVFITGKRSLFYFLSYWNQLPSMLQAHGYETYTLPLPWKNRTSRILALDQFLENQTKIHRRLHLIFDASSADEIQTILRKKNYSCIASVTLMKGQAETHQDWMSSSLTGRLHVPIEEFRIPTLGSRSPLFWKIHLLWTAQSSQRSMDSLGITITENMKEIMLDRCQFLAERDLQQGPDTSASKPVWQIPESAL